MKTTCVRRAANCNNGTTTIEFALVAPVMFALMAGILYSGLMILSGLSLQNAVEQAARCYSINTATCGTAAATQTYAQNLYSGVGSPVFTVSSPSCGHQASATLAFNVGWNVPLSAIACYP